MEGHLCAVIVNGTADIQVNAERDAEALLAAFAARDPNPRGETLIKLAGASHCFKLPTSPTDPVSSHKGPLTPDLFAALDRFQPPDVSPPKANRKFSPPEV
jgi:hypothetical protein